LRMVATVDNFRSIIYDLKYSWWFRFWAVLFVVGFVVSFVALGFLGRRSDIRGRENDFNVWYENVTQLNFPRFHIRIPPETKTTFLSYVCRHNTLTVPPSQCQGHNDNSVCVAFNADGAFATNNWDAPEEDSRINCVFNVTGETRSEDHLIAWELEGDNHPEGGNSYASIWIAPNDNSEVLLHSLKRTMNGVTYNDWRRTLVYHSSTATPGEYRVSTILTSFLVRHEEQANSYNGWQALGDIGGFAYFMVALQTLIMGLGIGLCFSNNSKFLGGEEH